MMYQRPYMYPPRPRDLIGLNYDRLSPKDQKYYDNNRERMRLNTCDKYHTIWSSNRLIWIDQLDYLRDEVAEYCNKCGYIALSEYAFDEVLKDVARGNI